MKWFELSTKYLSEMSGKKSDREKLEDALDFKYGDYDYSEDARSLNATQFEQDFLKVVNENITKPKSETNILLVGANSGYEYRLLTDFNVTAFDLSKKALEKLKNEFPQANIIHGNIEELPFKDKTFDMYISMRNIHSSNVNLEKALNESLRVTADNAVLIYSISNAYLVDKKLIKGMYEYASKQMDEKKAYSITNTIKEFLKNKGLRIETLEIPSEIIIIAKK